MIGRRGFLGALAGLPMVVQPKASVPEVTAPPSPVLYDETTSVGPGGVTITINCDTREFRRRIASMQRLVEESIRQHNFVIPRRAL